jgi:hypothetical protein
MASEGIGNERKKGVNIKHDFLQMIKMKKFTSWKKRTPKKKINMENIHNVL